MFIAVPGKFLNIKHIVMIERKDERSSYVFMTNRDMPIEIELSAAAILGKIHKAEGILND